MSNGAWVSDVRKSKLSFINVGDKAKEGDEAATVGFYGDGWSFTMYDVTAQQLRDMATAMSSLAERIDPHYTIVPEVPTLVPAGDPVDTERVAMMCLACKREYAGAVSPDGGCEKCGGNSFLMVFPDAITQGG